MSPTDFDFSDHNSLPCAQREGGSFCTSDGVREDFVQIAAAVARRLHRQHGTHVPTTRLAADPSRVSAPVDPVFEAQFERCYLLLQRAARCRVHAAQNPTEKVSDRLFTAVLRYLTGDAAHAPTLRKDLVTVLDWATKDFGRVMLAGTEFTARPERKLATLRGQGGAALLTPPQVALMTLLVRGVVVFSERIAARVVLGTVDDASAVGYVRHVTYSAYRSNISGADSPLLELGADRIVTELAGLRRRSTWQGGGTTAVALHRSLVQRAQELLAGSLEAHWDRFGSAQEDGAAADAISGRSAAPADAELRLLLEVREGGYRLPDGSAATADQCARIDARITELADLIW